MTARLIKPGGLRLRRAEVIEDVADLLERRALGDRGPRARHELCDLRGGLRWKGRPVSLAHLVEGGARVRVWVTARVTGWVGARVRVWVRVLGLVLGLGFGFGKARPPGPRGGMIGLGRAAGG